MKVEWNKVTWYSKLIAVVLFLMVFFVGFWFGNQYGEIKQIETNGAENMY